MTTSKIEKVTPYTGILSDQSALWMKFPNGVCIVWGTMTVPASGYATSHSMENNFITINTVLASPIDDPSLTVSAQKSSSDPSNTVIIARRPITNTDKISYLVIGWWK